MRYDPKIQILLGFRFSYMCHISDIMTMAIGSVGPVGIGCLTLPLRIMERCHIQPCHILMFRRRAWGSGSVGPIIPGAGQNYAERIFGVLRSSLSQYLPLHSSRGLYCGPMVSSMNIILQKYGSKNCIAILTNVRGNIGRFNPNCNLSLFIY